jgi:hypothetical protein
MSGVSKALAASLIVSIAFGSSGSTGTPSWTDVSTYVRSATWHRGRSRALDKFQAGTATVVLDNRDRRFDPDYVSGPYSGQILPRCQIRIQGQYNGVTYSLWQGYVDAWPQGYTNPNDSTATVNATDGFTTLANVPPVIYYDQVIDADTPDHRWHLDELHQWSVFNDSGFATPTLPSTMVTSATGVLSQPGSPAFVPQLGGRPSIIFPPGNASLTWTVPLLQYPFSFECWLETSGWATGSSCSFYVQQQGAYQVSVRVLTNGVVNLLVSNPGGSPQRDTRSVALVNDGLPHHLVCTALDANTHKIIIDGVEGHTTNTPGAPTIPGGVWAVTLPINLTIASINLSDVAIYSYVLTTAQANAHYQAGLNTVATEKTGLRIGRVLDEMGWPSAYRNLATGVVTITSYVPATFNTLDYCQLVADTEDGQLYVDGQGRLTFRDANWRTETRSATPQATFGDGPGELGYQDIVLNLDDTLVYNRIAVTNANGSVQTVDDLTSQTTYFIRAYARNTLLQNDAATLTLANTILARYKDASLRVEQITFTPQTAPGTMYPQALGLEIGSMIAAKRRPQKVGVVITRNLYIEGITQTVDMKAATWQVSYQLSAV